MKMQEASTFVTKMTKLAMTSNNDHILGPKRSL